MSGEGSSEKIDFSVDILFSEPLHFELEEIIAAVDEDFPSCQVTDSGINPTKLIKTDRVVIAML